MATLLYGCMSKVPGPFRLTSQRSSAYEYRDVIHKVSNRRAKTVLSNTVLVIEHYTVHGCSLPQPEVRWEAPERITVIDITAIPRQLLLGHVSVGICTGLPCGCLSLAVVEGYPGVEVGGERGPGITPRITSLSGKEAWPPLNRHFSWRSLCVIIGPAATFTRPALSKAASCL
jgi:hypothetical protein